MPSPEAERSELIRTLGYLIETPRPEHRALWNLFDVDRPPSAADHTQLFMMELVPYSSVYTGPEGMIGGETRDLVAGFWRAVGRTPPPEPDHLGHLLGLSAELTAVPDDPVDAAIQAHAARTLTSEHLAPWLGAYLLRVVDIGADAYREWAGIVIDAFLDEVQPMSSDKPLPAESLTGHLLTPARSGLIVTRSDLARCAEQLDLGLRIGERAYALDALLGQDRPRVVAWFVVFAEAWRFRLTTAPFVPPPWTERVDATLELLA